MKTLIQFSGMRIRQLAPKLARRQRNLCSGFFSEIFGRGKRGSGYHIPEHIEKPDYAEDGTPKGIPPVFPWIIYQNTPEEIECAREAGRISREVLDAAGKAVQEGVSTAEIDEVVYQETIKRGAYPSPLNYRGFPRCVCTSLNEVVCHGIPDPNRKFVQGDIVNIDVSCYIRGYHGDNSEMFCVGEVDEGAKKLLKVTYDSWQAAIAICRPGVPYNKIGHVIDDYVTSHGFSTTKNFLGHGVGKIFHTTPNVFHHGTSRDLGIMAPGHIFTIEPMINEGTDQNHTLDDGWTIVTSDNKRSAQFEHTLLITETGVEILTKKSATSPKQFWE